MGPRMKKTRNRRKEGESLNLDRLSSLPDSILTLILSFLDTKTVIRTSVLSKRYRLLWTLSQCLDFKLPDGIHSYKNNKAGSPEAGCSIVHSFTSYVNRVLQHREHSNLTSFRLSLPSCSNHELVEHCIDYAAKQKVQHLKIRYFDKDNAVVLPKLLMASSSLISLNLNAAVSKSIDLPRSVHLPNLKELRLKGIEFCSRNFNGELFTGSPSLETLILSKCWIKPGDELKVLDVKCEKLMNLEIIHWRSPWRCFNEHMINVNAQRLAFFKLQGHIVRFSLVENLACLNEGCILLSYPSACATADEDRKAKSAEACISLLRQIRCAKSLSLSLTALEIISSLSDVRLHTDLIFENLKNIRITVENKYTEDTMPINKVAEGQFVGVSSDCFPFDIDEGPKLSLKYKSKHKNKHVATVMIPLHVLHFLMESSPPATLFTVELPKATSSDQ